MTITFGVGTTSAAGGATTPATVTCSGMTAYTVVNTASGALALTGGGTGAYTNLAGATLGTVQASRLVLGATAAGVGCAAGQAGLTTAPVAGFPADQTAQGGALCASLATAAGVPMPTVPLTFSVTTGVVSTGTAKSTSAFTAAVTGVATTNYRGSGGAAVTDTAIVSNSTENLVATVSITLNAPAGNTASKISITSPSVLAIAPTITNTSPNYQSPTTQTNFSVQVTDSGAQGVNGQVVLVSVDRGALVQGFSATCGTSKAATATTAAGALTPGGDTKQGVIQLTVCGNQTDAPGKLTITAQNVSTTMANATSTLSMAGRPAKVTATATGNAISATVVDAGGNNVADGTPVRFTISSNAGATSLGATGCTTSTNGVASTVVSLIAASGTVLVSADWNETGAAATCGAAGAQQVAASVTVPGGTASSGTTTTPSAGTISSGSIPAAGGFGLIVYGGPISALVTASGCPAASAAFWATIAGNFVTYVPGTTITAVNADFNAAFPSGIPAGTPLIGKCK